MIYIYIYIYIYEQAIKDFLKLLILFLRVFQASCCHQWVLTNFVSFVFDLYSENRFDRVAGSFQFCHRFSFLFVLVLSSFFFVFSFFFLLHVCVPCFCVDVLLFYLISLWYLILQARNTWKSKLKDDNNLIPSWTYSFQNIYYRFSFAALLFTAKYIFSFC